MTGRDTSRHIRPGVCRVYEMVLRRPRRVALWREGGPFDQLFMGTVAGDDTMTRGGSGPTTPATLAPSSPLPPPGRFLTAATQVARRQLGSRPASRVKPRTCAATSTTPRSWSGGCSPVRPARSAMRWCSTPVRPWRSTTRGHRHPAAVAAGMKRAAAAIDSGATKDAMALWVAACTRSEGAPRVALCPLLPWDRMTVPGRDRPNHDGRRGAVRGKTILITGGAGFIASSLIARLAADNRIVMYDNFTRDTLDETAYAAPPERHASCLATCSTRRPLAPAMQGVDTVVHAAAHRRHRQVVQSPVRRMRVNMLGTANVLEAARAGRRHRSRAGVLHLRGVRVDGVQRRPRATRRSSARSARPAGRTPSASWPASTWRTPTTRSTGCPTVTVRPFNVYGPGQTGEGACRSSSARRCATRTSLIFGDGNQIRAWCYVDDMVEGVLLRAGAPEGRRRVVQHRQRPRRHHHLRPGRGGVPGAGQPVADRLSPGALRRHRVAHAQRGQGARPDRLRGDGRPRRGVRRTAAWIQEHEERLPPLSGMFRS